MTLKSKLIIFLASLLLSVMYYYPLMVIDLEAPQYPEGLGLQIWINKITGINQHDLSKINNLNHYIGMRPINPDSIPELKIMPWVVRSILILGIIVSIAGSRRFLLMLLIIFALLAIIGFIDYYKWGYDYGHNLDVDKAIIKIPGQSYQPPVLGTKKILNFKATSLPGIGGWAAILVYLVWFFTYIFEKKRKNE